MSVNSVSRAGRADKFGLIVVVLLEIVLVRRLGSLVAGNFRKLRIFVWLDFGNKTINFLILLLRFYDANFFK